MCPTFLKFEPKEEVKLEPIDLESNGRSPRSNCYPLNDQVGDLFIEFPSKSDEENEMKMVFKIEESEIDLSLVKQEVEDKSDMFKQNILSSANLKPSKDISKSFQCSICSFKTIKRDYLIKHMIVHKDPSEISIFKCFNCSYETKRKGNLVMHMNIHKNPGDVKMFKCNICCYESDRKYNVNSHLKTHNLQQNQAQDRYSESEAKPFQCLECPYKAKCISKLARHSLVHNSAMYKLRYKCHWCDFNSKHKDSLKRHITSHRDTSEIKMFKCELCHYENRYKRNLSRHLSVYHSSSASVYKCKSCNYTTKDSYSFKYHATSHKNKSEVKKFESNVISPRSNCSPLIDQLGDPLAGLCLKLDEEKTVKMEFEMDESEINPTLVKDNNDKSERNIPGSVNLKCSKKISKNFQCHICGFETIKKFCLKNHMVVHKDPSEIKMFKCPSCPYEGKRKWNLKDHMIIHEDPCDIKMFKCTICPYETMRKANLVQHVIIHKNPGDVIMFKCNICPYKSKRKRNVKSHLKTHNVQQDQSEAKLF